MWCGIAGGDPGCECFAGVPMSHRLQSIPSTTCQPLGFKHGCSLAKLHATTPPPPNFVDAPSIDAVHIMSKKAAITEWSNRWHAMEHTSHTYTEVLRGPPDGRLCQGLKAISKSKPGDKPTREAESTLFCFLTGHAFTGKYN